jgi:hypothetical protein
VRTIPWRLTSAGCPLPFDIVNSCNMSRATVLLLMYRVTLYHVDSVRTTTVH